MNVARSLARREIRVWIADRGPRDSWIDDFFADCAAFVEHLHVDLSNRGELSDVLPADALDAVVHAAVITATTEEVERRDARDIVDSNVGGTIEALQTAVARGASRFIYVSSPSAIGDAPAGEPIDEAVVPRPTSLYGITKRASEQIVERWADLHGLEAASVRIAQPYGPGERATGSRVRTSPIWEWLEAATAGKELVTGPIERARDWTYVEDTAEGITRMLLAERLPQRLYHLGAGVQATIGEVISALESAYGPLNTNENPSAPDLNPNISGTGRPPLDANRFARDFNWKPATAIADGMNQYITWWTEYCRLLEARGDAQ